MLQRPHFLPKDKPSGAAHAAHCVRSILRLVRCFWGSPSCCFGLLSRPAQGCERPRPVRNQGGTRLVPSTRGSDRTAALDEMRGPPSKSRGHRTPASSLLDRRHRCWIPTNGETHNPEPTHNHNHTSSLSVGHQAKNELCATRGPLFKKCHACPTSPVVSWRQQRALTRRRGARQGHSGKRL